MSKPTKDSGRSDYVNYQRGYDKNTARDIEIEKKQGGYDPEIAREIEREKSQDKK
jgi:hypothetical protein